MTKGQTIAIIEAMKLMNEIEVQSLAGAALCALLQWGHPAFVVVCQPAAAGDAPGCHAPYSMPGTVSTGQSVAAKEAQTACA